MAIDPPVKIADVTHLMLESYLSQITGITDWVTGFTQILGIQDDDSLLFAASISPLSHSAAEYALRKTWATRSAWVIQVNFTTNDIRRAIHHAHKWSRFLTEVLEATNSIDGMARYGANLAGTFEGLAVPASTTLKILDTSPWSIGLSDNGEGGAMASIKAQFTVVNP